MPCSLDYLIQLYDAGMPNQLQNVYLPRDTFYIGHIDDLLLDQNLDGHALASHNVDADLHLAEGALADSGAQLVVADSALPSLLRHAVITIEAITSSQRGNGRKQ